MNEAFAALNLNIKGVQITDGQLHSTVAANKVGNALVMSTSANRRVWFTGDPMPGMVPFAVMHRGSSWYHGDESDGTDLCGFCRDSAAAPSYGTDTHYDGEMRVIYLPEVLLRMGLEDCNATRAWSLLESRNAVKLNPFYLKEFNLLFDKAMQGDVGDNSLLNFILVSLQELAAEGLGRSASKPGKYKDVMPQIYALAHQLAARGEKLNLPQIAQRFKLTSYDMSELAALCGISLRQLFLNARLEQVRHALLTTDISVEDAAIAFGFNRQHLARPYTPWAGETPLQTKQRGKLERCWVADSAA